MADVQVVLTGSDVQLIKTLENVLKKQNETIDKFRKMQEESKRLADEAKKVAEESANSIGNVGSSIEDFADNIGSMAIGYATVNTAIGFLNDSMEHQVQLQKEVLELSQKVATSQQEAAKNLTGTSDAETQNVLSKVAPQIAKETGFSDIAKITDAVGAAYSASGDLEKSVSAVRAAAELTRLSPDQITTVASGALDVSRGSGIADARQNLAFLLSAGKSARIEDPAKLAGTLAPTVSSGVATVPGQDREQAAREIAALFTTLNQQATDKSGESTRTATITMLSKMEEFFSGKENDPGTVAGRLRVLREDEGLRQQFFSKPFGEEAFKKGFQLVATDGSELSAAFEQSAKEITFATQTYTDKVRQLETATPQLITATALANAKAASEAEKFEDTDSAVKAAIAEMTTQAIEQTTTGVFTSIGQGFNLRAMKAQQGTVTPEQFAKTATAIMSERIDTAQGFFGPTAEGERDIALLRTTISEIQSLIERQRSLADQDSTVTSSPITQSTTAAALPDANSVTRPVASAAPSPRPTAPSSTVDSSRSQQQLVESTERAAKAMERAAEAANKVAEQNERSESATKSAGRRTTAATAGRP